MKEFLEFFDYLVEHCNEPVEMSEEVKRIYEMLQGQKDEKPVFTESGLAILEHLQGLDTNGLKAKDIAEGMGVSSRKISGAIRKLITDGYVDKLTTNPAIYMLTDKGKEINVEDFKGER